MQPRLHLLGTDILSNYTRGMANSGIQPKQEDVDSICDITGISTAQAVTLLKVQTHIKATFVLLTQLEMAKSGRCSDTLL